MGLVPSLKVTKFKKANSTHKNPSTTAKMAKKKTKENREYMIPTAAASLIEVFLSTLILAAEAIAIVNIDVAMKPHHIFITAHAMAATKHTTHRPSSGP